MQLNDNARSAFARFCKLNALLWTQVFPAAVSAKPGLILVDLWHDNPGYILRSLLVAKYLQCHTGAEMVGLIGAPGAVKRSCPDINPAVAEELGRSFGITTFWSAPDVAAADRQAAKALLDQLTQSASAATIPTETLRERLKSAAMADGFPIGRFIYDTTVRSDLCATIKTVNASLRTWAAAAFGLTHWIADHLAALPPDRPLSFVTGHLDYNPWGLVAEKVRRAGGDVFWFRPENNVPVYHLKPDAQPGQTLNAVYHALETQWFEREIWPQRRALASGQKAYAKGNSLRMFYQRWTTQNHAELPPAIAASAAMEWRQAYSWDEKTPVIGVFAHAFADQPLADVQLYDDRYVWLAETLAFAAQHPERNWLIKLHPMDHHYDSVGTGRDLIAHYDNLPHIRFAQGRTAFNVVQALCNIGVTIFGYPGIQMAAAGKPVILAGNGPYTGCGFGHRATSIAHYHQLLLTDPVNLQPSAEAIERAQLYAYASALCGTPTSPLLGPVTAKSDKIFWEEAITRLCNHTVMNDGLYLALAIMLANQNGRVHQPFAERFHLSLPAQIQTSGQNLPLLTQTTPLHFAADEQGQSCLIQGFNHPIEWGVWTCDDMACLALRLDPDATPDSILAFEYQSVPRPLWYRPIIVSVQANGITCATGLRLRKKGVMHVRLPAALRHKDHIILRFYCQNLLPLGKIRLSDDRSRLGFILTTIRLVAPVVQTRSQQDLSGAITNAKWRLIATASYFWHGLRLAARKTAEIFTQMQSGTAL